MAVLQGKLANQSINQNTFV